MSGPAEYIVPAVWLVGLLTAGGSAAVPCQEVDYGYSRLGFRAVEAGAQIEGRFDSFEARICFAPDDLENSHFDVTVQLAFVDTQSGDRDEALRSSEFFFVERWAEAHYESASFESSASGYRARGALTLRDVTRPVDLVFSYAANDDGTATLSGTAELLRLDFDVGLGEWRDTQWVGNEVTVVFNLTLRGP